MNIPEFSQNKLECDGRACYKCGKCRDWSFDGPDDHRNKIQNWGNWAITDWVVFRLDNWTTWWHRRYDATCSSNLGYGAHAFTTRVVTDDENATICRRFPDLFSTKGKDHRFWNGLENLPCVCDIQSVR